MVHLSLNRKKSIMGIDAYIFQIEAGLFVIFLSLHMWIFMLTLPPIHLFARWMHGRDDRMVEIAKKYAHESDAWDPWHHPQLVNKRPKGFGRGLPL